MTAFDGVRTVLGSVLSLGDRTARLSMETPLLGAMAELDSMAVVSVIAGLEDRFGIEIADDEISADAFATVGSLAEFVAKKLGS
jgi:acyl carrier protein